MTQKQSSGTGRQINRPAWIIIIILFVLFEVFIQHQGYSTPKEFFESLFSGGASQAYAPAEGSLEVHFLDVGQAESILICGPEMTVLVDAGTAANAPDIVEYLKALGVTRLDLIINTHPHNDHFGGMRAVMDAIPTDAVLMTPMTDDVVPTTVSFEKLVTYLTDHNIPTSPAAVGDAYDLGGGGMLTILGPRVAYTDLNDLSIVCRVDFGEISFLLTGDAEIPAEKDLLAADVYLSANVLSAGHHGSRTSSGEEFLSAVSPDYVVISCGQDNDYGHPHKELMDRLGKTRAYVYRTDLDGTIIFRTDGTEITVNTAA